MSYASPATALAEGGTPADGARRRLLVGVGGARPAGVPRRRRGAPRALGERGRARVQRDARAAGEARLEVSNNAREYTSSGVRLRLASVRVLDVQPWSGPSRGATVVSVRARGAWPGGVRCRFGEASASAGWSGGASRLRCLHAAEQRRRERLGRRAALELPRRALERRQLLLPLGAVGERRVAVRSVRSAAARAWRCLAAASATRTRCAAACGSAAAPVLARYVDESQLECVVAGAAAAERARVLLSMNGQQYAPSGALVHVPAGGVGELRSRRRRRWRRAARL